ncbi:unannotated protein [freshwater metagenome]|uniref:Unannotated protein n=1 Tax=freshwater metagenome TaxID=449393 RepID=A0A6J7DAW9_9ZZZZ|nr:alpha/beta fold hydrolase [Actinomycetota bacterium]
MPNAVLVHGGFHGGWCWSRVSRPLLADGWTVHAPSLTGVADRLHLAGPDVGAMTHVNDIVSLIECEELDRVVLVGHSAGAHTAAGVAEAIPERIAAFIALDGLVPQAGESVNDVLGESQGVPDLFRQLAAEHDGVNIPPSAFTAEAFGVTDAQDAAWVERRMTSHPLRAFEEPVPVGEGFASIGHRLFIRCERFEAAYGQVMVDRFSADPGWEVAHWDTGHDAMITDAGRTVEAIVGAARAAGA